MSALVFDGTADTEVTIDAAQTTITQHASKLMWKAVDSVPAVALELEGPRLANHNGSVRALVGADLRDPAGVVTWRAEMAQGR